MALASTRTSSARSGRTATSSGPTAAPPRPSSSIPAATPRSSGSSSPRMGARCAAILITHGHFDHLGGVADLAEGTGAPVYMPEGERGAARDARVASPRSSACARTRRTSLLVGRRDARRRRDLVRGRQRPRPLARPPRLPRRRRAVLGRRPVRGLGRPHRPARRRLGDAARLDPRARRPLSGRDRRLPGPRPGDDARRRARAQPVPRRAARVVKFQAPTGTHDILPGDALWWRLVARDRAAAAALRLRADPDAGLRGHGDDPALVRARARTSSRRRRTPSRTAAAARSRCARRAPRRSCAPTSSTASTASRSRSKLYTIATMYRFDRPQAGRYREHTQLSAEIIGSADPAVDAELIQLYVELLRRFGYTLVGAPAQLDRRREVPARVPRAADRVARRARRRARRGRARRSARRTRCASST